MAHYYQPLAVQDVADYVGYSFDLSKKARDANSSRIIFCGVNFMAETAKILSPDKIVLNPNSLAQCPMAKIISRERIEELPSENPEATVMCYVNTTANVKAVADICVTSAYEKIKSLNPEVGVKTYNYAITSHNIKQIIEEYDIVVDGADNFNTKLLINDACLLLQKPFSYDIYIKEDF